MRQISKALIFLLLPATCTCCLYWMFRFEVAYLKQSPLIDPIAQRYQVPPHLVAAVIWQETRFNAQARGKAGEIGLMQVMPHSAAEWARSEQLTGFEPKALFDPSTNIMAGTWYLSRALHRWAGQTNPVPYALAEYNAGRSNALRWNRDSRDHQDLFATMIDYPSTRQYVRSIILHYETFGHPWERW